MKHTTRLRVRYNETDQMGRVYYANYLIWFEISRTEFLRHFGTTYREMEESGYFLPVSKSYTHYLAPAMYDDELEIETTLEYIKPYSVKFLYKIRREGSVINSGYSVHGCVDINGKLTRFPEKILDALGYKE